MPIGSLGTYHLDMIGCIDTDSTCPSGLTAGAKAAAGIVLKECADTAVLLFGGNGYTRTGQGEIAERMWREVNGNRIP